MINEASINLALEEERIDRFHFGLMGTGQNKRTGLTINQAGAGFCSELYEREYTHKIAVARPWLDIWQCSNKWQRERRVQTLWPRVRRPLSALTRDITLAPFAKIGLNVSLLARNQRFQRC